MEYLNGILGEKGRKVFYAGFGLVGVALGATQVGFAAADAGQPSALTVCLAVYGFLGGAFGATARANVGSQSPQDAV